ncbi:alpha/beta hydrolase [Bosea sp. 685]|uniref:alpha/beta hydrolase n=1 Tax=Bosea sp. 685 TaxID=3080057 RepID=UPI002892B508|nr:alpha/beta hydrolase [Bosea sp. 685]WNJ89840.1 alpha/beta hydrolase [Bosea sp. 685]
MFEPGIQAYVDQALQSARGLAKPTSAAGHRELRERLAEAMAPVCPEGMQIRSRFIDAPGRQIGLRIYRPENHVPGAAAVFFHGGGFVSGSIFTHDVYGISIAQAAGVQVFSVNYRLAPENPYPAAFEDAYFAVTWLAENGGVFGVDPGRIVVGGDSAGGNLAAACAIKSRDASGPQIQLQYLIFPCLDTDFETPCYLGNVHDPFLGRTQMMGFWKDYLAGDLSLADPYARPTISTNFSGLAPALVITAEHDPLRDEGNRYAEALAAAGTPAELRCVKGSIHGFIRAVEQSAVVREEVAYLGRAIRSAVS